MECHIILMFPKIYHPSIALKRDVNTFGALDGLVEYD